MPTTVNSELAKVWEVLLDFGPRLEKLEARVEQAREQGPPWLAALQERVEKLEVRFDAQTDTIRLFVERIKKLEAALGIT